MPRGRAQKLLSTLLCAKQIFVAAFACLRSQLEAVRDDEEERFSGLVIDSSRAMTLRTPTKYAVNNKKEARSKSVESATSVSTNPAILRASTVHNWATRQLTVTGKHTQTQSAYRSTVPSPLTPTYAALTKKKACRAERPVREHT